MNDFITFVQKSPPIMLTHYAGLQDQLSVNAIVITLMLDVRFLNLCAARPLLPPSVHDFMKIILARTWDLSFFL